MRVTKKLMMNLQFSWKWFFVMWRCAVWQLAISHP